MKINGPIWALGAMSGTSLDGVDAALIKTDGETISEFGLTRFRAYSPDEQAVLRAGLGRWPGEPGVAEAASLIERSHVEVLSKFSADLVGFHGQTLAHDPAGRGTHQVGDGAALAQALQTPVVWDFRSADVELGGQGAPLAPFYHFACAKWMGAAEPVGFLNLGGVGNLTCVDPSFAAPDEDGALTAFDTGPANAPINDLMRARLGQNFDRDGALGAQGTPIEAVVAEFLTNAYFHKMPPKSLDRDDFAGLLDAVGDLSDADAAATLTACATAAVAKGVREAPIKVSTIYVTGGGRHNPVMMRYLAAMVPAEVKPIEAVGLNGDMLEAQAFGYLAVRVARGLPTSCPATTGVAAGIGGGAISAPAEPVQEGSDRPLSGQTIGRL